MFRPISPDRAYTRLTTGRSRRFAGVLTALLLVGATYDISAQVLAPAGVRGPSRLAALDDRLPVQAAPDSSPAPPVWSRIPRRHYLAVAAIPPLAFALGRQWSGSCAFDAPGCASRRTLSTMGAGVLLSSALAAATTPALAPSDAVAIPTFQVLSHAVTYGAAAWWLPDWLAAASSSGRRQARASVVAGAVAFEMLQGYAALRGHPLVIDALGSTVSLGIR